MKRVTPSYFEDFSCIADRCRHSCCIGWEIDIDKATAARYRALDGALGQRMKTAMHQENGTSSFLIDEQERCPFLNRRGLCDIISALGHDALCDICATHPRFRFDYADRTEWGLGLCCEAAAALILRQEAPMTLVTHDDGIPCTPDEEEIALLQQREEAHTVVQNRRRSIDERESDLGRRFRFAMPFTTGASIVSVLSPLERMDNGWDSALERIASLPLSAADRFLAGAQEQLLSYFLYRQVPHALFDGYLRERIALAVFSEYTVRLLCLANGGTHDAFEEAARAYSAEIEYSDQNIARLLDTFAAMPHR